MTTTNTAPKSDTITTVQAREMIGRRIAWNTVDAVEGSRREAQLADLGRAVLEACDYSSDGSAEVVGDIEGQILRGEIDNDAAMSNFVIAVYE